MVTHRFVDTTIEGREIENLHLHWLINGHSLVDTTIEGREIENLHLHWAYQWSLTGLLTQLLKVGKLKTFIFTGLINGHSQVC